MIMPSLLTIAVFLFAAPGPDATPPAPFTAARFREHVAYLASDELAGRAVGSPGSTKAIDYLMGHLKDYGATGLGSGGTWLQEFPHALRAVAKSESTPLVGRNLLAVVPGKGELAKEAILVSAHHDHLGINPELIKAGKDGIYHGADDNASGCAALLLLAQALHVDRDALPASCRTVIFASFDAEEYGLVGSRYYVNHSLWPLERTAANLNFDMVGRLNRGKLIALDSESSAFLAERILALAPACGLTVETRLNGARRSDHANFLDRAIPAVHFNSGMHVDYHQVTDEVERIDSEGGARIAWLAYRLLRDTMETPGRLRYRRPSPTFDVQSILQFVSKLGIIPELNAQPGRAALIRFVIPGSPAAKHGIQSGDEIIGVNGVEFTSLIDAALIFGQLRLEQGLRLSIRCQGKTRQVTLPAEVFEDLVGPTVRPLAKDQFEVLFRYKPAGMVKSVTLAGTFNDWNAKAKPLEGPDKDGTFSTRLVLKAGTYEYKFVLDGRTWTGDPDNFRTTGSNGNSVLTVGGLHSYGKN
jgi:hypothetical protein